MTANNVKHLRTATSFRIVSALAVLVTIANLAPIALGYDFVYWGGRLGRGGVETNVNGGTDFCFSWDQPDNGTLTWFMPSASLPGCDATCFAALKARVQPELDKWALWIRESFAEAPNEASADVLIRFVPGVPGAWAYPKANVGNVLTKVYIEVDTYDQHPTPGWDTDLARNRFAYTILHEWGHAIGVGDLYWTTHGGGASFEGEDFCDHGLPSGPLPDPRTKADNVMETLWVTVLDNDTIHAAEWLWGTSGSDAIVTGDLKTRKAERNMNEAEAHHGLSQTGMTWTYRGTVSSFTTAPKVTLSFSGILAARDVGPGNWTPTIFSDRVEFDHAGLYEGNFKFEIDCNQGPERYGNAIINADTVTTSFTATPAGNGPQLFPFDQVFGADCQENKELDYFPTSSATVTINIPGVGSEDITLTGPTKVVVALGKLGDKDGDGYEEVPTQIVDMELTGRSAFLGRVIVKVRPSNVKPFQPSIGQIVEKTKERSGVLELPPFTSDGCAFSYFDVFFEIYAAGEVYHNQEPKRMEAQITYKPPGEGETYESPTPIELFDEDSNPTGIVIKSVRHTPRPPKVPTISEWGMVAIALLLMTGIAIKFGRRWVVPKAA